jgi:ribose transport system permease protein
MSNAFASSHTIEEVSQRQSGPIERLLGLFLPLATILLMFFFATQSEAFLTVGNLRGIALQSAATVVLAVPTALLLMSAGIDLSVGSTLAVAGVVAGLFWQQDLVWVGLAAGLAAGIVIGLINGSLVSLVGLNPIVVTLGTLAIGRGVAQVLAGEPIFEFPEAIVEFGAGGFLEIPNLVWVAIVVVIIGMIVLNQLPFGKYLVAVGVNERAAYLAGLRVKLIKLSLYVATGLGAAIAGMMLAARFNSAPGGTLGVGTELLVLTAVLLGGVPFTGGRGAIWRVVIGVLLLAMLRNGLVLLNFSSEAAQIVLGAVLIVAAALELVRQRLFKRQ